MRASTALLLLVCLLVTPQASAGKLSRARAAVRAEPSTRERDDDEERETKKLARARREVREHRSHDEGRRRGGSFHRPPRRSHGGGSFGFFSFSHCEPCCPPPVVETHVVYPTTPVVVPPTYTAAPIQPTVAESFARQFAPYPYACGCDGFMVCESPELGQGWSGRVEFEMGSDFDDVDRTGLGFLLEGTSGLGVDFDWNTYSEEIPGGGHDELHVGDCNVLYRIAESDRALVRAGLGAAWFGDRYDTDFGINFTLKANLAPSDPIVLSGELDLGTLGDAQHVHAAGTIGVMLDRCEIYGGYDYRRIGDVEIEGPMMGVRVWF